MEFKESKDYLNKVDKIKKDFTTKEAKVLLGLQDRKTRKMLADMCDAGLLMKVGATSNLKYVLQKIND